MVGCSIDIAGEQCRFIVGQSYADRHTTSLWSILWLAVGHAKFATQNRSMYCTGVLSKLLQVFVSDVTRVNRSDLIARVAFDDCG